MLRKFVVLAALSLAVAGWTTAAKPNASPTVTIMTQNMDDGTDQTYIIAALTGAIPDFDVPTAVDLTFAELQASNFQGRAALMAAQIAERKPELVALQEAALWRFQPAVGPEVVLYDNIDLLVSALRAAGVPYDVVAVNRLTDLAAPGGQIGGALRFTDRNAVLVRSDLRPPRFHLSNVHARTFDAALPFAGFTITAGWISVDVHRGNQRFRFVTTHLESPIPGEGRDASIAVQMAQAQELIHALRNLTIPVVICGDFNSDALHRGFVDDTPTVDLFEPAGYTETWSATTHPSGDPDGRTWPFFLEDQFPPSPFFVPFSPVERIDLFFSKGMQAISSDLVVAPAPPDPTAPPFGSDHAGVIAVFQP
ncbi:MAG TPA: endonuclease/exonuclease/phosphatase family protein [Thermoanaerobaculia bacterium]|nr:endonuclease/exonuclease/phosphatase family protein [Thermoanaerobaculia bacterium]